jgi:transposase InsO family protein
VALKVVSMEELKLELLTEPERTGDSVAEVCRRRGISRETFYLYRRRYELEGAAGLAPRSRRPLSHPGRIHALLEVEICALRQRQPRWGARRIRAELARAGTDPPAVSTIHQALRRNGLVAPGRPRRPKADKRFERAASNELWQIDATEVALAGGKRVCVFDCLDDHARYLLAALACPSPCAEAAWACFSQASAAYGLPQQLLSDNHSCFTGRRHGVTVPFERRLARAGVKLLTAAPAHPQTLGKLERLHRTLKEWLADQEDPVDLERLQALLDRFKHHYNDERPHQGIGDQTPAERYRAGFRTAKRPLKPRLAERENEPRYPPHSILRKVWRNGITGHRNMRSSSAVASPARPYAWSRSAS